MRSIPVTRSIFLLSKGFGKIMTIGIFTAVPSEAASFVARGAVKVCDGQFTIYKLSLGAHDAVLCCPPTVGEIAAAAGCQLLITKYGAEVVLNFGVVGALTERTSLFSAVLVKDVVHYDMDTSFIDRVPVGKYDCFDDVAVACDETLIAKALQVVDLPLVRCASADKFVDDAEQKRYLNKTFGAEICDMESAGTLFTCKFNGVPCLMVKCISDSLFGGAEEYETNAEKAAENFFDIACKLAQSL